MTTLNTSLTFLTFKEDVVINTIGTESINLSNSHANEHDLYSDEKHAYLNYKRLKPKYPQKVRESAKELEQQFLGHRCLHLKWETQDTVLLLFNSGVIASISFDEKKLSTTKIIIDHSLCGKLVSDHVTDIILNEKCLLICYSEPKLSYIHLNKQLSFFPNKLLGQKKGKILGFEPQIITVDVIGPSSRRLEKKLSLNNLKDCVLVWWRFTSSDVWPWMPVSYSVERVNMIIYSLNDSSMEVLCSAKVHGELVHATFSKWHSNRILTLEEITEGGTYHVNICSYEILCGRCQCTSLSKLPLRGHLLAFDWSSLEDKLLLCDQEKSLLIYDLNKNTTLVTNTLFVAKEIVWHPGGLLALVIGSHGSLQCFDAALTMIKLQIYNSDFDMFDTIDLSKLLYPQKLVQDVLWQKRNSKVGVLGTSDISNETSDTLLIYFEQGTLVFVNFSFGCITKNILSPLELISQYLKCGGINESVCLLQCLNWCQQAELCYQCLSKIVNNLLRKPVSDQTESALELTLGTFYNSVSDLPETILYDYHQQIDHIARRFFHHLLRYHRFEKAFLLAVDLQFRDLFLDLHHVAKQKNETMLAIVALKHAEELEISDVSSYDQSDAFEGSEQASTCSSIHEQQEVFEKCNFVTRHKFDPGNSELECASKSPLTIYRESRIIDFETNSRLAVSRYDEFDKNFCNSVLSRSRENHDPPLLPQRSMNHDFSTNNTNLHLSTNQSPFFNNWNFEYDVINTIKRLPISNQDCERLTQSSSIIATKSFSLAQRENHDEDEQDVEEKQIKFVHFGIV